MPTYISLIKYTQKGSETIKDSPGRLDAAKQLFKKYGGELKQFYLVLGEYDLVAISEAPNDESVVKMMLGIAAKGSVQTRTLRAFNEAEFRKIVGELP